MNRTPLRSSTSLALLCLTWLWLSDVHRAEAQLPAPPAPPQAAQPPLPPSYPPGGAAQPPQAYPQQVYPQQVYPQQVYPQQTYPPQQAYPQAYPPQTYAQPGYAAPARPRRPPLKRGMLAAGISVLSASYGVALITGSVLIDTKCCRDVGAMMMIPVVGPYIAASVADEAKGLLVLLGSVQIVGTGLLIGGIARYLRSKKAAEEQGYYTWKLPHERSLGFAVSSSPMMMGPRLRLRF